MFLCFLVCQAIFKMASCCLPDTLTPDVYSLTPTTKSMMQPANPAWGRLFSTLLYLEPVDLDKPTCSFGRSQECDIKISGEKFPQNRINNISKSHFVIIKDDEDSFAFIKDLSKNGTYVNGHLIGKGKKIILQNDDEIAVGFKDLRVYVFRNFQSSDNNYLPQELRMKYEVSRTLGEGAGGVVKLIFDKYTFKQYAVKKIVKGKTNKCYSMHHPDRIKNEVEILKSLSHPCVISVQAVVETDDSVFIVMEYVEGGELSQFLRGSRHLSEYHAKFLFYQMVIAIQYLHRQSVTHRDLKPENILLKCVSYDTLIKVTDFGLSKIIHDETVMRTACGTLNYTAPEILDSRVSTYDHQVDVWSLGVILYYMLGHKLPFKASDDVALGKLVIRGSYVMSGQIWENVSSVAKDLIKKMLVVDPTRRIKVEDIIKHPWINKDVIMRHKVHDIINSEFGTGSDLSDLDTTLNPPKRSRLSQEN